MGLFFYFVTAVCAWKKLSREKLEMLLDPFFVVNFLNVDSMLVSV